MSFNFICSSSNGANTGVGKCKPQFADIIGMILLNKGQEIDVADLTDVSVTTFNTNYVITKKAFPLPKLAFDATTTPELKSKEIGGQMQYLGEAERRASFTILQVFGCLQQELSKLNNGKYTAIFVDSNGAFLGREGETEMKIKGFNLSQIWFESPKPFVAYGEVSEQKVFITIDSNEFEASMSYGYLGFPYADFSGLIGCQIEKVSNTTSSIVVKVTESCNKSQPVTGLLAGNFALAQSGSSVSITSVTESSVTEGQYTISTTITANPYIVSVTGTSDSLYSGKNTITYA